MTNQIPSIFREELASVVLSKCIDFDWKEIAEDLPWRKSIECKRRFKSLTKNYKDYLNGILEAATSVPAVTFSEDENLFLESLLEEEDCKSPEVDMEWFENNKTLE